MTCVIKFTIQCETALLAIDADLLAQSYEELNEVLAPCGSAVEITARAIQTVQTKLSEERMNRIGKDFVSWARMHKGASSRALSVRFSKCSCLSAPA